MFLLARRNLLSEPFRLLASAGGVALSVFLISLLLSMYRGWDEKIGGFVEGSGVDVWVARQGTTDFLSAASIVPADTGDSLELLGNVSGWNPLIVRPMAAYTEGGESMDISLIGFQGSGGLGGPPGINAGEALPGDGEAVVDKSISDRYGVDIGDTILVVGHPLRVVGLSEGGNFVFWQAVFVDYEGAERLLEQKGFATFLLFDLQDPDTNGAFAERVESERPDLQAATSAEFAEATRERILGELLPIISVVLVLAFIVGLTISGLTIYTATVERAREWGILKAVGFRNSDIYRVVLAQSVATAATGFFAGALLAFLFAPYADDLAPQLILTTKWYDVFGVGGLTLAMAVLASFVPVRRIGRIDPVAVFQA